MVFRRALGIKEKVLGPHHPSIGVTLNNIGRTLRFQVGAEAPVGAEVPVGVEVRYLFLTTAL